MTLEDIVRIANNNEALMDGTTGPVQKILASAEIVFAVWQDRGAPNGVSTLLLKGQQRLEEIASEADSAPSARRAIQWSAVKVLDREMAIAARDTLVKSGGSDG